MDEIRIYVGTYAKYNAGSIAGAWLDCEKFSDKADFLEACRALHHDEPDPELMFQDYEGFPKAFYSESAIDERLWEWLELDEDNREIISIYLDNVNDKAPVYDAGNAFMGKADNKADFAAQWLEDTCGLEGVPKHLENYIDFDAYARDMELGGDICFVRHEGEVWAFRND
jgi:antirestriction protein